MSNTIQLEEPVLVLHTCNKDMESYNGFIWPKSGPVKCDDWSDDKIPKNGLHGLLWGEGDGSLLDWSGDSVWLVVEIYTYVELNNNIKFPSGEVVFCGDSQDAIQYISDRHPNNMIGLSVVEGCNGKATVGCGGHATVGSSGTATTGDWGTAVAGYRGTAIAGIGGYALAGKYGNAISGKRGNSVVGMYGTASSGEGGHSTAGSWGKAIVGNYGFATASNSGIAIAGINGIALSSNMGKASAGLNGIIQITYFDGGALKTLVGHVGLGKDIKPETIYEIQDGVFVECSIKEA